MLNVGDDDEGGILARTGGKRSLRKHPLERMGFWLRLKEVAKTF